MPKTISFWAWIAAWFTAALFGQGCATNATAPPINEPIAVVAVPIVAGYAEAPPPAPEPIARPVPLMTGAELRAVLAERRATHLARLKAYADAGVFPKNRESDHALNVFVDADGHLCAAANLIARDGLGELVARTARADNYILLAEVTSGELYDWMLTSGFTQEEIGMIQRPYRRPEPAALAPDLEESPFAAPPPTTPVATVPRPPQRTPAERERERVQAQLTRIHAMLAQSSGPMVELAATRLEARPDLIAALAK